MKKLPCSLVVVISAFAVALTGCSTAGGAAADLGLAGAGSVAGYQLTDHKIGGAAAGAAVGYVASKVAQSEVRQEMSAAERRGFDSAMNQAVKQQYWIIQNQQRSREASSEAAPRLTPVVIPETKIGGVIQKAHVEYIRVSP